MIYLRTINRVLGLFSLALVFHILNDGEPAPKGRTSFSLQWMGLPWSKSRRRWYGKWTSEPDEKGVERPVWATMTPEQAEAQRLDFAYGNAKASNAYVTREMVDEAADVADDADPADTLTSATVAVLGPDAVPAESWDELWKREHEAAERGEDV